MPRGGQDEGRGSGSYHRSLHRHLQGRNCLASARQDGLRLPRRPAVEDKAYHAAKFDRDYARREANSQKTQICADGRIGTKPGRRQRHCAWFAFSRVHETQYGKSNALQGNNQLSEFRSKTLAAKTTSRGIGSSLSYAKRYQREFSFSISSTITEVDDDRDGHGPKAEEGRGSSKGRTRVC